MRKQAGIIGVTALLCTLLLQGCGSSGAVDGQSSTGDTSISSSDSSGSDAAPTLTFTGFSVVQVNNALSGKVVAFFSEDMDASSINVNTFKVVDANDNPVPGSVLYIGVTGVFTPTQRFDAQASYTATLTTGVRSQEGVPLAKAHSWTFTTPSPSDLTGVLVQVASVEPAGYATEVPLNSGVNVTFGQVMDPATVNSSTVAVYDPSGAKLAGRVHYSGLTASFIPASSMTPNTTYHLVVTTDATSLSGQSMDGDYKSLFTTASSGNSVPPQVVATAPMQGDGNVSLTGVVVADFNEGMDTTSVNTGSFTLLDAGGNPVDGTVSYTGDIAVFTPDAPLQPQAVYTATVSGAAQSTGGVTMLQAYSWSFTTGSAGSLPAPSVLFTSPSSLDINAPLFNAISVAFDQPLDPSTVTAANVQVAAPDGSLVSGTVTYQGGVLFFMPDEPLQASTQYTVTLSPAIRDAAGGYLAQAYNWSFTTMQQLTF
ncbi:MAG TPA: Ig-like domain-containing protein [Gammaproteobacteria bacterium]|jgi:hypothetical protein